MVGSLMKKKKSRNIYDKYITIENIYITHGILLKKLVKIRKMFLIFL